MSEARIPENSDDLRPSEVLNKKKDEVLWAARWVVREPDSARALEALSVIVKEYNQLEGR